MARDRRDTRDYRDQRYGPAGFQGPPLNLLFPTAGGVPSGVAVSRATSKLADLIGSVRVAGTNVGCIESAGLVVERAHTNLLPNSNGSGGTWANSAAGTANTAAANATTAPDGTTTATTVTYNSVGGGGWSWWQQSLSGAGAGTYTLSLWIKAGTVTSVGLAMFDSVNGGTFYASRQLSLTSSWQRFSLTFSAPNGLGTVSIGGQTFFGGTSVALGTLSIWGVNVDVSSYARSAVPTTSATATCSADLASATIPTNMPDATGSAEIVFTPAWSSAPTFPDNGAALLCTRSAAGAGHKGIEINIIGAAASFVTQAGASTSTITSGTLTWTSGQAYTIKAVWGVGNMYLYIAGTLVASDTSGTAVMPTGHDTLLIGQRYSGALVADGRFSRVTLNKH